MADAQFAIPEAFRKPEPQPQPEQTYEAQQTAAFSAYLDSKQYTPETQPQAYHFVKEIEDRIDSYRYTAIEIEEAKRPWLRSLKSLVIAPKPLLSEFIERESIIGGQLLQKVDAAHDLRLWYATKDWFFGWSDGKVVMMVDSAVRYQFTDEQVYKSYQGRPIPFTEGEEARLLSVIPSYEAAVRHILYPFDDALIELNSKSDYDFDDLAKKDDFDLAA